MCNVILTGFVIAPEQDIDALLSAIPEHLRLTRAEPGCLSFKIIRDKTNPFKFTVYEEFINKAAFDFHQKRTRESSWFEITKNIERHYNILTK